MASTTETQPRRADYDGRTVDELVAEIKRQQFGEGGLIRCVSEGEGRGFLPRFEDHVLIRITEERESMDEKGGKGRIQMKSAIRTCVLRENVLETHIYPRA